MRFLKYLKVFIDAKILFKIIRNIIFIIILTILPDWYIDKTGLDRSIEIILKKDQEKRKRNAAAVKRNERGTK